LELLKVQVKTRNVNWSCKVKTYTPGEVAVAIGVSASSVRNWTEQVELQEFLSDMAVRRNAYHQAKQREYTLEDLYVMNTIAKAKTRHNGWSDVAEMLADGQLYKDLPPSAALVLQETAAEGFADKIMLHQRIEFLEATIREQETEIEQLRGHIETVRREERDIAKRERQDLQTMINDLNRLIGKLEGQIEILKCNNED
jgi:DNA-binding transcriptional MerR regulator